MLKTTTKKTLLLVAISIVLTAFLVRFAYSAPMRRSVTTNVFIVVIDGARYSEQFGSIDTYIPHIWNDLRPLGSINTNFWSVGQPSTLTITTPGHANILTGTWQMIPNGLWYPGRDDPNRVRNHPTMPTLWEYVREEWRLKQRSCFIASYKHRNVKPNQFSNHPEYGSSYRARFKSLKTEGYERGPEADFFVYEILVEAMNNFHPRFVLVNLGATDNMGHEGWKREYGGDGVPLSEAHWNVYTFALANADEVVWMIWNKIQSDEFYKDKTMLIVTNDHGRHLDGVKNSWSGHGHGRIDRYKPDCEGCRHLIFLAVGPNIKAGIFTNRYRTQIDILPTIARLMGFNTPYSYGHVMWEILTRWRAF